VLSLHQAAGCTHFKASIAHARQFGLSIDTYVEFCGGHVRKYLPFLDQWGMSNDSGPKDSDWPTWQGLLQPWLDAVKSNGLVDLACVGWQLDNFNVPGDPIIDIVKGFASQFTGLSIPVGTHWVNEAGAWWQTGGSPKYPHVVDRFSWWREMKGFLSFFYHQGDVQIDIPTYQAKLVDTLNPFGGDTGKGDMGTSGLFGDRPYSLIVYECSAQAQFDVDKAYYLTQAQGDQRSYYLTCTHARSHAGGYGNGGGYPDGSAE
jgi:hypothetical protein